MLRPIAKSVKTMLKKNNNSTQYQEADLVFLVEPAEWASPCEVLKPSAAGIRPLDLLLDLNDFSLPACRNHPEVSASSGSTMVAMFGINCNLYQ